MDSESADIRDVRLQAERIRDGSHAGKWQMPQVWAMR